MNIPKFRAWNLTVGIMVDVITLNIPNKIIGFKHPVSGYFLHQELSDFILMQSTGLTDKNGVEIFEGDIVKTVYDNDEPTSVNHTVKWFGDISYPAFDLSPPYCEESNSFSSISGDSENITIEVIGNIHQNRDLLNV